LDLHLYKEFRFTALVFGGEQEKACVGTGLHQIAGMAKALELSYDNLEERAQISELKNIGGSTCH
jgi:cysteine sulfinate desulfinase/cysteine desulfurase-like protein